MWLLGKALEVLVSIKMIAAWWMAFTRFMNNGISGVFGRAWVGIQRTYRHTYSACRELRYYIVDDTM